MKSFRPAILICIYIFLRMAADPFLWQKLPPYYSLAFEVLFVSLAYFTFRKQIVLAKMPKIWDFFFTLGMVGVGFAVYRFTGFIEIPIPFDLGDRETVILLLAVAPILEELIFRMALWESFQALFKSQGLTLLLTSLLFALGHFTAYWLVPEQLQAFIVYQTIYVAFLGLILGCRKVETGAVLSTIYLHFGFNFGFFFASR